LHVTPFLSVILGSSSVRRLPHELRRRHAAYGCTIQ
jgi:hypothetical protein